MSVDPPALSEAQFLAAEHEVELKSKALRKELRLIDLVGIQILNIVGLFWVGTAGKLGSIHVMFWVPAVLLFYVPSGIVVAHLVKEMPLEGGLYQWAKLRFSPALGFLVAMNLWLFNLLTICKAALVVTDNVAYALGPSVAWLSSSRPAIIGIEILMMAGLMVLAWRGLALGKWINNMGGFIIVTLFLAIIVVALPRWFHGPGGIAPVTAPVIFAVPALSLLNLNLLGKIGFGAFGGFDGVGVFAGECRARDVAKSIRRSVCLAAPVISLMFIAGTASVLAYSTPDGIDLVSPITQVMSLGAPHLVASCALLLIFASVAGYALSFNLMIRLPMVAGWDHLLPAWFSRLHPRYRTPVGSILFAGAVGILFSVLANAGTGSQEAFQLVDNTGGILYALTYLVMFAIPLAAPGEKPAWGVRAAALSGFLMTLLYVVLSVFPIIEVQSPWLFTAKIVVVVGGLQCLGAAYYRRAVKAVSPGD
ncbi:MAG: APC family permease [Steroidobacteraceae bacterium]